MAYCAMNYRATSGTPCSIIMFILAILVWLWSCIVEGQVGTYILSSSSQQAVNVLLQTIMGYGEISLSLMAAEYLITVSKQLI